MLYSWFPHQVEPWALVLLAGSSGGGSSDYANQAHAGSKLEVDLTRAVTWQRQILMYAPPQCLAVIPFITFINFRFKPCTKDSV